jgi:uncharacterized delta-60 repeat protein
MLLTNAARSLVRSVSGTRPNRRPCRRSLSPRPQVTPLEDRCLLSGAGSLDPSFGGTGIVTTSWPRSAAQTAYATLIQPWDGKIIAAGTALLSQASIALARYNPDGSLDTGFGSCGKATALGGDAGHSSAVLYPHAGTANDGKIVVSSGQVVDRLNVNGTLDTAFGDKKHGGGSWNRRLTLELPRDEAQAMLGIEPQAEKKRNP